MTKTWTFAMPNEAYAAYVAAHMRHEDRREVVRWTGQNYGTALGMSIRYSDFCRVALGSGGLVYGIFGAMRRNLIERTAQVWFLSTDDVWKNRREFLRCSRDGLDLLFREMPDVEQFHEYVDSEYAGAVRWIEWLGGGWSFRKSRGVAGGRFRVAIFTNPHYSEEV